MMVFLSPYPDETNSKDGMVQRVAHIDKIFDSGLRTYLDISFRRNFKRKYNLMNENVMVYKLNFFMHFFFILRNLLNADLIYVHSILRFLNGFPMLMFAKGNICLDVHGAVPEEARMTGSKVLYYLYTIIEYFAFYKSSKLIFVSEAMLEFYEKKYKIKDKKKIVFNIYSNVNIDEDNVRYSSDRPTILYSGNLQRWQNIDAMVKMIVENYNLNYDYLFLVGDPTTFKSKLPKLLIDAANVTIQSVQPESLHEFYAKAHYGIILRDDIVVNRIANPTKMIEYLIFGLTPIVRLVEIGDFHKYNYEFIEESEFSDKLKVRKSIKNADVAKSILRANSEIDLKSYVLK